MSESKANKKAKYILFKGDKGDNSSKPCAFYSLSEGCKNGNNCMFLHGTNTNNTTSSDSKKGLATFNETKLNKIGHNNELSYFDINKKIIENFILFI